MMSALLHVKDLKVSYGGINAVKGIDLHVNQGELVALIGANGAGKSSSMKAIAGLLTPSAGEIHFTNQETRKLPAYELVRLGLGMVPEGRGVFKRMTIFENLQMGAYLKTNPKDIERKLEEVYSYFPRLKERLSQLAGTLSGGEQQMVVLARAFASKPKYLLLDEMSLGLAPVVFMRLLPVIEGIAKSGVGVLLVEQFAHLALGIAQDAVVVTSGHESYHGSPKKLMDDADLMRKSYMGE